MKSVHRYCKAKRNPDGSYLFQFKDLPVFRESFNEIIAKGREEVSVEVEIREEQQSKGRGDLRYWKGPLLEAAFTCYRELGHNLGSKADAEFLLKSVFYYDEVELVPIGTVTRRPKSLKNISEEDLVNLIEKVREFINTELEGNLMSKYEWANMLETGEIPEKYVN